MIILVPNRMFVHISEDERKHMDKDILNIHPITVKYSSSRITSNRDSIEDRQ